MTKKEFIRKFLSTRTLGKDLYFYKCIEYWLLLPNDIELKIPYYSNSQALMNELKSIHPLANIYWEAIKGSGTKGVMFCKFLQKLKETLEDEQTLDKNNSTQQSEI